MKRIMFVAVGMMIGMSGSAAWAAEQPQAGEVPAQAAATMATSKAKQQAEAAATLNGTAWEVEFSPMSGEKLKKPMNDALQFDKGKLTSAMFTKDGYAASNYTLSIGDDGIPIWETMQMGEKGMASWRGELHGETMSGILSRHPTEGPAQDYSFLGHHSGSASANEPSASTSAAPMPPAQPAPAAQPKAKKKGWFGR